MESNTMSDKSRNQLFIASCVALTVTSMTFAIRAGMIEPLGVEFGLDNQQLGIIISTAFWGFPLAVILGSWLVDYVGMKSMVVIAFACHILGIVLTIFSGGFWGLFFSTLLIGIANGSVEAACNPLVATIYPNDKTTKLNHFHLWFPGGIVIGGLVAYFLGADMLNWGWKLQMATMLIPAVIYGYLFLKLDFPKTERIANNISDGEMYKSILSPLFLFMVVCMFGTAVTELGINQWIGVLLDSATDNALLLLVFISLIMALGRGFAGQVVHRISTTGVLLFSAVFAALGLFLMSTLTGGALFFGAAVFAVGVTYFWPTMIGFVAEYIPKSGALGLGLIGGAGMFAVSIFQPFIGKIYDSNMIAALPEGADMSEYAKAAVGSEMAVAYGEAQLVAGPAILSTMVIIPIVLIVAFAGLHFYMKKK
ncbi:MAG: MFS transporter [Saprospiraceae bacterium]